MKTIGVLGGGQLAKLLALKGRTLAGQVFILSPSENDPAAQNNPFWIKGDPHKAEDLKNFFKRVDIITFENEFYSAKKLEKATAGLKGRKIKFAPSLQNLSLIQDRLFQKKLLVQNHIPTADFGSVGFKKIDCF